MLAEEPGHIGPILCIGVDEVVVGALADSLFDGSQNDGTAFREDSC